MGRPATAYKIVIRPSESGIRSCMHASHATSHGLTTTCVHDCIFIQALVKGCLFCVRIVQAFYMHNISNILPILSLTTIVVVTVSMATVRVGGAT